MASSESDSALVVRRGHKRQRRGHYAVVAGLMIFVLMAFGALAVDVSYMRLVQAQAQNIADAATQAALMELRASGSVANATVAAELIAAKNVVGGRPGAISEIDFGVWDPEVSTFTSTANGPNAVRVVVAREDDNGVAFWLAPVLGFETFDVTAEAISASRPLHLIISLDVTSSWSPRDFGFARAAILELAGLLTNSYGPQDLVGMTVFAGPYAYEFTPLTPIEDIANDPNQEVLSQWSALNEMSRAGVPAAPGRECDTYRGDFRDNIDIRVGDDDFAFETYYANYFRPSGGCYPVMPREYRTENGTDQSLGVEMAQAMFHKEPGGAPFRAHILITDGRPNGWGVRDDERNGVSFAAPADIAFTSGAGTLRDAFVLEPYEESRYEFILRDGGRSVDQVRLNSVALAEEMWSVDRVHTYTVSFAADDAFLDEMTQGQGYYRLTDSSSALVPVLQSIGRSLPLTLVQ